MGTAWAGVTMTTTTMPLLIRSLRQWRRCPIRSRLYHYLSGQGMQFHLQGQSGHYIDEEGVTQGKYIRQDQGRRSRGEAAEDS